MCFWPASKKTISLESWACLSSLLAASGMQVERHFDVSRAQPAQDDPEILHVIRMIMRNENTLEFGHIEATFCAEGEHIALTDTRIDKDALTRNSIIDHRSIALAPAADNDQVKTRRWRCVFCMAIECKRFMVLAMCFDMRTR